VALLGCVRINVPQWYEREDWNNFINRVNGSRPATWHEPGSNPTEFSDVFVVYDGGEGSDADDIPGDIWAEIGSIVKEYGLPYAVVRITNV
jgi:hypothetical protein